MKRIIPFLLLVLAACQSPKEIRFSESDINIIPKPEKLSLSEGYFEFTPKTVFVTPDTLQSVVKLLTEKFQKASGWDLEITNQSPKANFVHFQVDTSLPKEGYSFHSSSEKITIKAADRNGFVYALQTLRQLLPKEIESSQKTDCQWVIPCVVIDDQPQYAWRGLMLDVARHFFPKEYILKTIDRMAMLKLNTFHFHLLDNEGWRIEIKKYPKLTEVGAWRVGQFDQHWNARVTNDPNEKGTYGGFFTQEDIKEIVAHAAKYGITVVPEIEMPAHVMSAIAAYPELSCHKRPIAVPSGGVWPITDIYCAGQEETFSFLEDVLSEVIDLFPSKYVHIGGDEATHTEWEKCPKCLQRMKDHKLKNAHELQSYFIKRINTFLKSKNKQLIGWDEIIDGGLADDAVVMVWRGNNIVKKATEKGNQVILTSQGYIDQYQGLPDNEPLAIGGYLPVSRIYNEAFFEKELNNEERSHILGLQANLWAEYIPNEKHSEYMLFPRLFALSEVFWKPEKDRNWADFAQRLQKSLARLEVMDINYAKSIYQTTGKVFDNGNDGVKISLQSETPNADIRYVLNQPDFSNAISYTDTLHINQTTQIQAAVFFDNKPHTSVYSNTITFHKAIGKPTSYQPTYHKSYSGQGDKTLTNIVRGTKDFHDKQWLAWLVKSPVVEIDLEEVAEIEKVVLGAMENQGSGIYFPVKITLLLSSDGKNYVKAGEINRPYASNGYTLLQDFAFEFEKQKVRFIKLEIQNLAHPPKGGDAWLFIDEVQVF
ncbi:beta-N-acetylhexosaminidase [Capnocytophaga sp.]|uniref:beta-N-acetylhexosaminidase n=1 Tax=Capnocytophaga sp. TaxID=44737 RepID=UPI0026DCB984|nr:beta-N-acetylhexosaminidase [Capnocytophaga sp.]MDO5105211.1 beta-N-acetylhexosaminidase [Capnocytophaga sp.]